MNVNTQATLAQTDANVLKMLKQTIDQYKELWLQSLVPSAQVPTSNPEPSLSNECLRHSLFARWQHLYGQQSISNVQLKSVESKLVSALIEMWKCSLALSKVCKEPVQWTHVPKYILVHVVGEEPTRPWISIDWVRSIMEPHATEPCNDLLLLSQLAWNLCFFADQFLLEEHDPTKRGG